MKAIFPYWLALITGCSVIWLLLNDLNGVYSTLMGATFSLLALRQMIEDQTVILIQKQRRRIFISFIFRLGLYAIPIIIALKYPNYFKFWVILLFLFCSQLIFIIREAIINYKHYKKRMKDDG